VIIRENADLVELKQLGFDPLDPPSIRSAGQEGRCLLRGPRKFGGKWWRSEKKRLDVQFVHWNDAEPTDEELRFVWFGWLKEGGLLAIQFEQDERLDEMAATMEERCKLLTDRFGARFYEDPALYDGLADVFPK
jgi:hypothetical protein